MDERRATGGDGQAVSRRGLLKSGAIVGLSLLLPRGGWAAAGWRLAGWRNDGVGTADGFTHDVVLRWGDPLFPGDPSLDSAAAARGGLLDMRPGLAARWFGYNCDAVHFFPLQGSADRGIVCVNHEYTNEELFLPGIASMGKASPAEVEAYVRRHPTVVALTQAMHGVSIAVIEKAADGRWRHTMPARHARRLTAGSPCEIAGPARGHRLLRSAADPAGVMVYGTLANCAGGQTPWGTFLTAEENVQDYFGGGAQLERADAAIRDAHRRLPPRRSSVHGWEHLEGRFDLGSAPTELLRFGWIVEIDPYDPQATPRKRTALGRFQHECAATATTRDGRLAVYSGDDARFEYIYKFVTEGRVHPTDRSANRDLLDRGTLYVARFDDDGSGKWLPLQHGAGPLLAANGFHDQGDVVVKARAAADLLGATPMDRPEDVAADAATGRVFVSLTKNELRLPASRPGLFNGRSLDLGPNAANPRGPNEFGHVIEIVEDGADTAAKRFAWRILLRGGDAAAGDPLGCPDNLDLDREGRLWVATDGRQPGGGPNGCFVVPTDGQGRVQQVLSAPPGAEVTGLSFTPGCSALLLSIQHPGEGGNLASPLSAWPDGPGHLPRPSLIALRREDGKPL